MRLGITAVLLVLGLAAGCGGSDSEGSVATTPAASSTGSAAPPPAVLADPASGAAAVAVTRKYLDAFINGRAELVCALESPAFARLQVQRAAAVGFVKEGTSCLEFVKKVVSTSKTSTATGAAATYLVTAIEATSTKATVRVEYPVSAGANPDTYVLVRRNGAWVINENVGVPTG